MIEMPEIATAQEVADYLKIDIATVYHYAASNKFLSGICIGKGKYNLDALKAAITAPPYRYLSSINKADIRTDKAAIMKLRRKVKHA